MVVDNFAPSRILQDGGVNFDVSKSPLVLCYTQWQIFSERVISVGLASLGCQRLNVGVKAIYPNYNFLARVVSQSRSVDSLLG